MLHKPHFSLDFQDGGLSLYLILSARLWPVLRLWTLDTALGEHVLDIRLHSDLYIYDCSGTREEILEQIRAMFDDPVFDRIVAELT